jgi:hypothetical protein
MDLYARRCKGPPGGALQRMENTFLWAFSWLSPPCRQQSGALLPNIGKSGEKS